MQSLSVGETLRFAWHTFTKRPGFFIGILLIITTLSGIVSRIFPAPTQDTTQMALTLLLFIIGIAFDVLLKMGSINVVLQAHDEPAQAHLADLWAPRMFWSYIVAGFFSGLIIMVGLVLLILPGIYFALRFFFVPYLVIDRKLLPVQALKESWRITEGHLGELFLFLLALIAINLVGAIVLLVGLLVSIPVTMLAVVHAYRTLEHRASEVATVV